MERGRFAVTFWGVRGGYPMPGPTTVKYGGNTTCVEVQVGGHCIIIDGGTGIIGLGRKVFAEHLATGNPIFATLLLTHTHHDHTQGLPFFIPTRHEASTLHIFGPMLAPESLEEVLDRAMSPPVFPLGREELYSRRSLGYARNGDTIVLPAGNVPPQQFGLGDDPKPIPPDAVVIKVSHGYHHPKSGILFFRICYQDRSFVMATDTEGFIGGDRRLIEFARGTDLLIHDAEYDEHEYADEAIVRQGWGHSTWRMAVDTAIVAQVGQLALTHHSPLHNDAYLETILEKAQAFFPNTFLAREGDTIELT